MIWFNGHMQSRIDNVTLESQCIESFNITFGRCGSINGNHVLNELFNLILMQDIHPDGFKQITLNNFGDFYDYD